MGPSERLVLHEYNSSIDIIFYYECKKKGDNQIFIWILLHNMGKYHTRIIIGHMLINFFFNIIEQAEMYKVLMNQYRA